MSTLKMIFILVAAVLMSQFDTAYAQDNLAENATELYMANTNALATSIINKHMLDKSISRYKARGGKASAGNMAAGKAIRTNFTYTPTASVRQQAVSNYTAPLKKANQTAAAALASSLGSGKTNYTALYHEINEGTGLSENNAADAMAVYLILNWMMANNVKDGKAITVPMARGVSTQATGILAQNPKLKSPTAVAALGELFKVNSAMLQVGWLRAIKDQADAAYRQKAATQFRNQYKFDLSKMKLTNQGLVAK